MRQWQDVDHWAGMALEAVEAGTDVPGWTVRIGALLPERELRGDAARAVRNVRRTLNAMSSAGQDFLRWDDDLALLCPARVEGPAGQTPTAPMPVLALGGAHATVPARLILGARIGAPVIGMVAVQRGYITAVQVTMADGKGVSNVVWQPAGSNFPNENPDGQATIAAFAVERGTGASAVLGRRVSTLTAPLTPEQEQVVVPLDGQDSPIGFAGLLDDPRIALLAAMGRPLDIPDAIRGMLPAPGWVVGRWWLHTSWQAVLGVIDDRHGPGALEAAIEHGRVPADWDELAVVVGAALGAVPAPPRDLATSWARVAADQAGPCRLGDLTGALPAQHLPPELFAEFCIASSPTQDWLWRQLRGLLDHGATKALLEDLEVQWQRWPELHEPDRFLGVGMSARR